MPICSNCQAEAPADAYQCPVCQNRLHMALLVRETTNLDRFEDESIARYAMAHEIDRSTALATLQTSHETSLDLALLAPSGPTLEDLFSILSPSPAGEVSLEKISLVGLFDQKGRERDIVHKGLLFLRRRLFAEALEWWTLHREDDPSNESFDLLLLLMQMYTHQLASRPEAAAQARNAVKRHPAYERLAGRDATRKRK